MLVIRDHQPRDTDLLWFNIKQTRTRNHSQSRHVSWFPEVSPIFDDLAGNLYPCSIEVGAEPANCLRREVAGEAEKAGPNWPSGGGHPFLRHPKRRGSSRDGSIYHGLPCFLRKKHMESMNK